MKAYLLLLGVKSCHDGDEFQGIYTDIIELKAAYDALLQGKGKDYDSYLSPVIYEFNLNEIDRREHTISAEELTAMVEKKIYLDDLRKEYPYFMHIELNEDRIREDGYEPEDMWNALDEMLGDEEKFVHPCRELIAFTSSGLRSWLLEVLENTSWFMKYVRKWEVSDSSRKDDVIAFCRKRGIKIG